MLRSFPLVADAPVAQLDRASASGAEGHRFKSCQAHHTLLDPTRRPCSCSWERGKNLQCRHKKIEYPGGPLAQLVEQLTLNQRAVGSTPTRPTNILDTFLHVRIALLTANTGDLPFLAYGNASPLFIQCPVPKVDDDLDLVGVA